MKLMPDKMENCPFCGGSNLRFSGSDNMAQWIVCRDCYADGPMKIGKEDAMRGWNRRRKIGKKKNETD